MRVRRPRGSRTASEPLRREVREAGEHEIRPRTTTVTGHGYHLTSVEHAGWQLRNCTNEPYQRGRMLDNTEREPGPWLQAGAGSRLLPVLGVLAALAHVQLPTHVRDE